MPRWLSAAFVLEEGFPIAELRAIVADMADAAEAAGVRVVTGDTKVVPRGAADGLFVTTAGVGIIPEGRDVRAGAARRPRAALGHHGRPRHGGDARPRRPRHRGRHRLRHRGRERAWSSTSGRPRRPCGSCATPPAAASARSANELAQETGFGVVLDEPSLPVAPMVNGACEMLGIDPLYVANEGKVLAVVAPEEADAGLAALRAHPLGARRRRHRRDRRRARRARSCCAPRSAAPGSWTCSSATRCPRIC